MVAAPVVEMTETDRAYKLSVEVPGVEPAEIDVFVDGDMLVIAGEKKDEREETEQGYRYSERSYGAFERRIGLPADADPDAIKADVRKGVLKITVPKNDKAPGRKRRIAIDAA
jgi:HSP20 family protein